MVLFENPGDNTFFDLHRVVRIEKRQIFSLNPVIFNLLLASSIVSSNSDNKVNSSVFYI